MCEIDNINLFQSKILLYFHSTAAHQCIAGIDNSSFLFSSQIPNTPHNNYEIRQTFPTDSGTVQYP